MSEKYIGVVYKGATIPFPSPEPPAFGHGPKYIVHVVPGQGVFFLDKKGREKLSTTLSAATVAKYVKRGEWAEFTANPFSV